MEINLTTALLTALAGITSVASPCVLPVVPIIVTGTTEDHRVRPLLIVFGLSVSFVLMGIVSTLFSSVIAGRIFYLEKAVGIIIALFGIFMLFDINLFKKITVFTQLQTRSQGRWSGLLLGLSLGVIWIPCIGPVLSGVLALVASQEGISGGIFLLMIYSIGFSVPILIAGYGSHFFRQRVAWVQKYPMAIRFASGGLLIVFGIYIFKQGMLGFAW